jgi:hypothetical protein
MSFEKFPPVERLSLDKLREIVAAMPVNYFHRTPRQKDAHRELLAREEKHGVHSMS